MALVTVPVTLTTPDALDVLRKQNEVDDITALIEEEENRSLRRVVFTVYSGGGATAHKLVLNDDGTWHVVTHVILGEQ